MNDEWRDKVRRIKQYIDDHVCEICYVYELSSIFNVHTNSISAWFREAYGICPKKYMARKKIQKLIGYVQIHGNGEKAFHYATMLGYGTDSALCKLLKRELNLKFCEFIEKYAGD